MTLDPRCLPECWDYTLPCLTWLKAIKDIHSIQALFETHVCPSSGPSISNFFRELALITNPSVEAHTLDPNIQEADLCGYL